MNAVIARKTDDHFPKAVGARQRIAERGPLQDLDPAQAVTLGDAARPCAGPKVHGHRCLGQDIGHHILADAADDGIASGPAVEQVIPSPADQAVSAVLTKERVIVRTPIQRIAKRTTCQQVIARAAAERGGNRQRRRQRHLIIALPRITRNQAATAVAAGIAVDADDHLTRGTGRDVDNLIAIGGRAHQSIARIRPDVQRQDTARQFGQPQRIDRAGQFCAPLKVEISQRQARAVEAEQLPPQHLGRQGQARRDRPRGIEQAKRIGRQRRGEFVKIQTPRRRLQIIRNVQFDGAGDVTPAINAGQKHINRRPKVDRSGNRGLGPFAINHVEPVQGRQCRPAGHRQPARAISKGKIQSRADRSA